MIGRGAAAGATPCATAPPGDPPANAAPPGGVDPGGCFRAIPPALARGPGAGGEGGRVRPPTQRVITAIITLALSAGPLRGRDGALPPATRPAPILRVCRPSESTHATCIDAGGALGTDRQSQVRKPNPSIAQPAAHTKPSGPRKKCSACARALSVTAFSKRQWRARTHRRCANCISPAQPDTHPTDPGESAPLEVCADVAALATEPTTAAPIAPTTTAIPTRPAPPLSASSPSPPPPQPNGPRRRQARRHRREQAPAAGHGAHAGALPRPSDAPRNWPPGSEEERARTYGQQDIAGTDATTPNTASHATPPRSAPMTSHGNAPRTCPSSFETRYVEIYRRDRWGRPRREERQRQSPKSF